jgi:maltose O-acetyltransferase
MCRAMLAALRTTANEIFRNSILGSAFITPSLRRAGYRAAGLKVGSNTRILAGASIGGPDISIGDDVFINGHCYLDCSAQITIGDRCSMGHEVMLCTSSHEIGDSRRREGPDNDAPITIGDGCWIGARSLVLPGVTIGEGCVIAAGSMVVSYCEPNGFYMGSPAVRIHELRDEATVERSKAAAAANGRSR